MGIASIAARVMRSSPISAAGDSSSRVSAVLASRVALLLQVKVVEVGRVGLAKLRLRHGEVAIERESERGRDDGCDVHRVQHGGSEVPVCNAYLVPVP